MSFIDFWRLDKFPGNSDLPKYRFSEPIGPNFSIEFLLRLCKENCQNECLDFDTGKIEVNRDLSDVDGSGDYLYLLYKKPESWVYVLGSDLEWGVILSNVSPDTILPTYDLKAARADFLVSYSQRTTIDINYYDAEKLSEWARISGLN